MLVKPASYFLRPLPGGVFGRLFRFAGTLSPFGPEAIVDWLLEPGGAPGEVLVTVNTLPDPGDGPEAGDGLGELTDLQRRVDDGAWITLGEPQ